MSTTRENELAFRKDYVRYGIGFLGALALVYISYLATTGGKLTSTMLAILLLATASVQLIVQLKIFLHVGDEKGPKLWLGSVAIMIFMILIVVVASVWIMYHLNENMGMSPKQMEQYMLQQNSKGF